MWEAIQHGESLRGGVERSMLRGLEPGGDRNIDGDIARRLEILAWLVAEDRLEIRVVLPKGPDGHPVPSPDSRDYYHPKEGVFEDAEGNKLAFSGSGNESLRGWRHNYETFTVFTSWPRRMGPDLVAASPHFIAPVEHRFEALWNDRDDRWIALPLPEAVRKRLLQHSPSTAPTVDPLERERSGDPRATFRFLREAPFMRTASRIGVETSAVTPWPHQDRVIDSVVERYPHSFLFCDEVGLGKTIEAGLALRQLVVSKRVRRSLILAPASVVRQWQEELWEKCALDVPRYERGSLIDVRGRERQTSGPPWGRVDHLIASSQLAKRSDRREEVLEGEWDLVLIDEAHHARRKEFGGKTRRPNHLLQLLGGHGGHPGLKDRTRCLYLLTATPMQVHPLEVWDLLKLLGLEGRWGASEDNFERFFEELRKPFRQRDWTFLLEMTRDHLESGGGIDTAFAEKAASTLGPVSWRQVRSLVDTIKVEAVVRELGSKERDVLGKMTRHHTPIRSFVWRNGRDLLRRYRERGILSERVPHREPKNEWIDFTPDERSLYERIEEYISEFYRKYEERRRGLGFVMTVYRRRLTSSFHAARRSLERRRASILGESGASSPHGLTGEDLEQDDLGMDIGEELQEEELSAREMELEYLDDFISELHALSVDSKLEFLKKQLASIFRRRDSAILFTQYTDTLDYLRESLRPVYGSGVACYSGRGGESWDGERWVLRKKEEIKEEFRGGDTIKLLLCTESASEGLNLQTCGVLINYDMPWNPMRVEQRIGRIDRIGQRYDVVRVHNYFFRDTVEAIVYERLSDRIDWFKQVVGNLQPILHRVERAITQLAMTKREERDVEGALAEIRERSGELGRSAIDLDALVDDAVHVPVASESPVTLSDLERAFLNSGLTRNRFQAHPSIPEAYWLGSGANSRAVTFRREVFDRHSSTVELMTYGNPTFDELLAETAGPGDPDPETTAYGPAGSAMILRDTGHPPVSVCVVKENGGVGEAGTMSVYEEATRDHATIWSPSDRERARDLLEGARARVDREAAAVRRERLEARRRGLVEEARRILLLSAHVVEVREGFGAPTGEDIMDRLRRRGVPYPGLLRIVGDDLPRMSPSEPSRSDLRGKSAAVLKRRLGALKGQGVDVLRRYAALEDRSPSI